MRRCLFLIIGFLLIARSVSAQALVITPSAPAVNQGATQQFTVQSPATITYVNSGGAQSDASSGTIAASAVNVITGNLLIVGIRIDGAGTTTISSIADTAGNTFVQATGAYATGADTSSDIWYSKNVVGNAADIVTVTYSTSVADRAVIVLQYSGASTTAPFESAGNGYNSSSVTSSSFSTASAGNLNLAVASINRNCCAHTWTVGTNYTLRANAGSPAANDIQAEDRNPAPSGSQTASISSNGGNVNISVASFKPPLVAAGAGAWSVSGTNGSGSPSAGCGTINSSTGLYSSVACGNITAQQSVGGYQMLPNNHVFNSRIDSLPVNSNNTTWLNTVNTGAAPFGIDTWVGFPINFITPSSSDLVTISFTYTPANNGSWRHPRFPNVQQESGYFPAILGTDGADHHLFSLDTTTGQTWEQYQGASNCSVCTSQSGITYRNVDYGLPPISADAGGMQMEPLVYRLQELEQAVATGGTVNHAVRMTFAIGYECNCFIWPATTNPADGGVVPFGARIRLNPSFDISSYSAIAKVIMKQMQQYGWLNADGGLNWDISAEANAWPAAYVSAFREITGAGPTYTITNTAITGNVATITASNSFVSGNVFEVTGTTNCGGALNFTTGVVSTASPTQFTFAFTHANCGSAADTGSALNRITNFMQFVDESGLMISSTSGITPNNREIVTYTRTSDSATSSVDVALQGIVVNFPKDYLYVMAGSGPQQLPVYVNIGNVTWSMSPTVGTITAGGLYTPPTTQSGKTTTTITATSTTNGAVAAQLNVTVFPNGVVRLIPSQNNGSNYTDSGSHVWFSQTGTNQPIDASNSSTVCGNVGVFTDSALWNCEIGHNYGAPETRVEMLVANGTYNIVYHYGTQDATGTTLRTLSTGGNAYLSAADLSTLAGGQNQPYTSSPATLFVFDNHLSFIVWSYNGGGAPISSISITQVSTSVPAAPAKAGILLLANQKSTSPGVGRGIGSLP